MGRTSGNFDVSATLQFQQQLTTGGLGVVTSTNSWKRVSGDDRTLLEGILIIPNRSSRTFF